MSGKGFVQELQNKLDEIGVGTIATVSGRYYSMDRDNRWDRTFKAYDAMVNGVGQTATNAVDSVATSYENGVNDEFMLPTVILRENQPIATVNANDSVIFFNFRPDRARQITRPFCDENFDGFVRAKGFMPLTYVCFTNYDITIPNTIAAYGKDSLENTLGEYLASKGKTQLRLAETEKYAHVTFFFNGGVEEPNVGEDRILVPSPKVATYDLKPEMSAYEVGDNLVRAIESAAIKAIEAVDVCVGNAVKALLKVDGQMFVCADHGNSEQLVDYVTGEPFTAHTTNPVPFILVNAGEGISLKENGKLADIAPTLLDLMEIEKPVEMTGTSLLLK